jgi:D-serine deaminase-like pyridoxal phosphate-dependent protein
VTAPLASAAAPALGPSAALLGIAEARAQLVAPALLLDLDDLESNLALMHGHCAAIGVACRPHAKGHKSPDLARRQIAAGAIGISCATLAEVETMVEADIASILLTSPLAGAAAIERLGALNVRARVLIVTADSATAIEALAALASRTGARVRLLIDIEVGQRRTGAVDAAAACALTTQAARASGLEYAGLQAYWGHLQHVAGYDDRRRAVAAQLERLAVIIEALRRAGLPPRIVSGGGTGTCDIDHHGGLFTEIQPGSYVMMDAKYDAVEIWKGGVRRFAPAMRVLARVANQPDRATLNAGSKALSTDGPLPRLVGEARAGDAYAFAGDEFGVVQYGEQRAARLHVDDAVELIAPHCDTTANLHACFHAMRGDRLVEIWPLHRRGMW